MASPSHLSNQEQIWRQKVSDWYPNLLSQTYFLPPHSFRRVPYDFTTKSQQVVLIPKPAHTPGNPLRRRGPLPQPVQPPLAAVVYPELSLSNDPLSRVQGSDVTDDQAMQKVLQNIRKFSEGRKEVMMVLSQLEFRKYLHKQVSPIHVAAAHSQLLPTPVTLGSPDGDFDILIISRQYGLVIGEVKSVGADPQYTTDQAIVKRVEKAVAQLDKAENVLGQLVSDLAPVNVTKTLMLPNVTSIQLQQALATNPQVKQAFCQCMGEPTNPAAAVARCLCADSLSSSEWWERAVTDHGPDGNMTDDIYSTIVARFCGPATTIEVPTVTTPQRVMELRTESEATAHTGFLMAILTLYPDQVDLVNTPDTLLPRVLLWGPPGTGKTVVLLLKAIQWGRNNNVHLLSIHAGSRAVIFLMKEQLQHVLGPTFAPQVHCHAFDFDEHPGDVEKAVNKLAAAAQNNELFVIADEVYNNSFGTSAKFDKFCTLLNAKVSLHLFAAAVERDAVPSCVLEKHMTKPVRCPPTVLEEVEKSQTMTKNSVLKYSSSSAPRPTEGPPVRKIQHYKSRSAPVRRSPHSAVASVLGANSNQTRALLSFYARFCRAANRYSIVRVPVAFFGQIFRAFGARSEREPLPGHSKDGPANCQSCSQAVKDLLEELRVGQPGQDLQYRDVFILCHHPSDAKPVVTCLGAQPRPIPVKVVTPGDSEAEIRKVALAVDDVVTVTDWHVVMGLERRIVIVMGDPDEIFSIYGAGSADTRLQSMSRSTSLLVMFV